MHILGRCRILKHAQTGTNRAEARARALNAVVYLVKSGDWTGSDAPTRVDEGTDLAMQMVPRSQISIVHPFPVLDATQEPFTFRIVVQYISRQLIGSAEDLQPW